MSRTTSVSQNWSTIKSFLPEGWIKQCLQSKALVRLRQFTPEVLLRVMLIHLLQDFSLRQTVATAHAAGLVTVSTEAFHKRLGLAGEWFRWITCALLESIRAKLPNLPALTGYRIRIMDGTTVQEPGSKGANWRIHMSISYPSMRCDEVLLTDVHTGESFQRYSIQPGDICMGDINYGTVKGLQYVQQCGGFVLVRLNLIRFRFFQQENRLFDLLPWLRQIRHGQVGEVNVQIPSDSGWIHGRICAQRKSPEGVKQAQARIIRESRKKGHTPRKQTLEAACYFFVFTTLPEEDFPADMVLDLYPVRWQVELLFKRLKSLLGLGHLKKYDPATARAWLQGKLMIAALLMKMQQTGEDFFPSGDLFHRPGEYLAVA